MDINSLLQQARQFQEKMNSLQEGLAQKTVTATVGGGMVTAVMNGRQELISLDIKPEMITPAEKDMLQDLVVSAVNDAVRRTREMAQDEMRQLTGGMNIPGLF